MNRQVFHLPKINFYKSAFILAGILFLGISLSVYIHISSLSFDVMSLSKNNASTFEAEKIFTYQHIAKQKLPLSMGKQLNIWWPVTSKEIASSSLTKEQLLFLEKLSTHYSSVVLSVTKENDVSEESYFNYYESLQNQCAKIERKNLSFILYPTSEKGLSLCLKKDLFGIGVAVHNSQDIKWLDTVYHQVNNQKPIIVSDVIKDSYGLDISSGVKEIYKLYYTLAMDYPDIHTVLVSDVQSSTVKQYTRAYDFLKNIRGTYAMVSEHAKLSGKYTLILWNMKNPFNRTAYVKYRWNDETSYQKIHYPYPLQLDTKELPNGVSRLNIVGFSSKNKVLWHKMIETDIFNGPIQARAPRENIHYALGLKPIYNMNYIPVLMYHSFKEKIEPGESEHDHTTISLFDKQLQALLKEHYTPVTFYDLDQYLKGKGGLPAKPIIITADDGYLDNYTLAYPLLKKYHIPATFFVSTGFVGKKTSHDHFDWKEASEMERSGLIDIQIHGYNHPNFTTLSKKDIEYQISLSQRLIENYLGTRDVVVFAYPEFRCNRFTRNVVTNMKVAMQMTNLEKKGTALVRDDVKRINVPNTMSGKELVDTIKNLTITKHPVTSLNKALHPKTTAA